jgi:putative flippase GtrA
VDWVDDLDSRVDIVATALADLRGMARLGSGLARGSIAVPRMRAAAPRTGARPDPKTSRVLPLQIVSFMAIGIASTIAYVLLYLLLRGFVSAQGANVLGLLVTAIANTAANRRLTFGISGRFHATRHQVKGLITFGIGLALTSGSLAALQAGHAHPVRALEVSVLVAANLVATVIRFVLYRTWVFGGPRSANSHQVSHRKESVERDHLPGEAFEPHPAAVRAKRGPAPAARA